MEWTPKAKNCLLWESFSPLCNNSNNNNNNNSNINNNKNNNTATITTTAMYLYCEDYCNIQFNQKQHNCLKSRNLSTADKQFHFHKLLSNCTSKGFCGIGKSTFSCLSGTPFFLKKQTLHLDVHSGPELLSFMHNPLRASIINLSF